MSQNSNRPTIGANAITKYYAMLESLNWDTVTYDQFRIMVARFIHDEPVVKSLNRFARSAEHKLKECKIDKRPWQFEPIRAMLIEIFARQYSNRIWSSGDTTARLKLLEPSGTYGDFEKTDKIYRVKATPADRHFKGVK